VPYAYNPPAYTYYPPPVYYAPAYPAYPYYRGLLPAQRMW
jgi:hypothetical protein